MKTYKTIATYSTNAFDIITDNNIVIHSYRNRMEFNASGFSTRKGIKTLLANAGIKPANLVLRNNPTGTIKVLFDSFI